ncbi:MAG: right-handed parallel beta-helix repeat-containing protein [Gemmataceae bacterium]|nr:right-handed parallel beta-helix repeat-containing protein [Gemmataceae bacterium]
MARRNPAPRLWNRRLWLTTLEDRLAPAAFTVTNTADSGAGSLRAAVIAANGSAGLDTITFTGASFGASATITLTSGELAVSDSLIIDGTIKGTLTVSGNNASRIFNINNGVTGSAITVALQDMTLTKGATSGANDGGAIFIQDEDVTLTNCLVSANTSASDGGAIRVEATGGKLTLDDCTIQTNSATGGGGGVSAVNGPTVIITNSTLSGNSATAGGFMNMFQGGTLTVTGSTFSANNAVSSDGGALFLNGVFASNAIRNCTLSGNFASSDGGAIAISSTFTTTLTVQNCTIASNVATVGNGGGIARTGGTGTIGLTSTIVFSNGAGTTADNLFTTGTVNATLCLITNTTGVTTFSGDAFSNANIGVNPNIGSLASNGGPTQTRALLAGSVAIDAGSNPAGLTTDQRGTGYFRVRGKAIDIGAFELPDDFVVTNTNNSGAGSLRQAVLDANAAVGLDTIAFDATVFAAAKTITLTTGELLVTEFLTVEGPTGALTVSGNNAGRIFHFENASAVASGTLRNMTLTAGKAGAGTDGGAILSTEPLTIVGVTITNSNSGDEGGAIRISGAGVTLSMDSCTLSGNSAVTGGAIAADPATSISIKNSTLNGNSASGAGGAFTALGSASVSFTQCTLSGNSAATGGGIALLVSAGNNNVLNCTITGNTATGGKGGGVYAAAGTITFDSTIASSNLGATGPDIFNPGTTNLNFSAVGDSIGFKVTGANNLPFGTDLLLGPLAGNGGATKTHAPAVNSPVLGKGNNVTGATTDQRGVSHPRQRGADVDIGAVEVDQIVVVNTAGSGAGSLDQAVLDANANGGRDTITFDTTVFSTQKTINTANEMVLSSDAEIQGPVAGVLISGVLTHRIFSITGGTLFSFSNMSLVLGKATGNGGALLVNAAGNQSVTFNNCTLSFNSASGTGGAIELGADTANLIDCTLSSNRTTGAAQDGGAINVSSTGAVILTRCSLATNSASGDGGAIANQSGGSAVQLFETTLSGNSAGGVGGGIFFDNGTVGTGFLVRNSTLSDNTAGTFGGGIGWNNSSGTLTIQNSTITNNTANTAAGGGGISVNTGTGNLNIESSIVSGNINGGAPDIDNPNTTTVKNSAIGDNLGFVLTSAGGNLPFQPHANLKLGALSNNGGPTLTHSPQTGSPLINAGSNPAAKTTDQRGFPRLSGSAFDIGSVEFLNTVVKNINDSGIDSLRQIILETNVAPGAQTITFDSAVFASQKTITLTTGEIEILDALSITGPAAGVILSANKNSRVLNIGTNVPSFNTSLSNLTLRDGVVGFGEVGGAVHVSGGTLTVTNCTLFGNSSAVDGGAIASGVRADLIIINSTIRDNTASGDGGGITMVGGLGSLTMSGSLVANNKAGNHAGGIWAGTADLSIINSTIADNSAGGNGGGLNVINISQPIVLRNLTVTGNSAATGGGISMPNVLSQAMDSCIVFGNSAGSGPEISFPGTLNVGASLIGSKAGVSTFTGDAFTNAHIGVDPLLGPLQDNGGPTLTRLPALTSPAVNNGSNPSALTTDQRGAGFARVFGGAIDVGSVETHTFTVTNTNNSGAGSLRQAVLDANANSGLDGITFDPTVFATAKTITLTTGELAITDSVTILGPAAGVTVNGNGAGRVFNINGAGTFDVAILDMTLTGGSTAGDGGAIILQDERLTLTDTTISNNKAANGGAVWIALGGTVTVLTSTISNNAATGDGGAFGSNNSGSPEFEVRGCTIAGNSAPFGAALHASGLNRLLIDGSTIAQNTSGFGALSFSGTVPAASTLEMRNSTLSGNVVSGGSGLSVAGVLFASIATFHIRNCTLTNNDGNLGTGALRCNSGGTLDLESSVVSGNAGNFTADIRRDSGVVTVRNSAIGVAPTGGFSDLGGNLPLGATLKLGVLAGNGGPTMTHLPAPDSPLVNAGSNPSALTTDQRGAGFLRNFGGGVDIGAIESRALIVSNTNDSGVGSLRQAVLDANNETGVDTITFDPTVFATNKTIKLTSGELNVSDEFTVNGPTGGVTVSGNTAGRIFNIDTVASATFERMTFTGGMVTGTEDGGAIQSKATALTIRDCVFDGNSAGDFGGAVVTLVSSVTTLERVTMSNNSAGFTGGGFANFVAGPVTVVDSAFFGNFAGAIGGALAHTGGTALTIRNTTISGNTAGTNGGGILHGGNGAFTLDNSTVVNNKASGQGGGIYLGGAGSYDIRSTIVAGNSAGTGPQIRTISGTINAIASLIGSKAGVATFTGDAFTNANIGVDPLLGPLQDNGGPTLTHMPASVSKALGNGSNPAGLTTDQRGAGFPRVRGTGVDIGAVEIPLIVVTNNNDSGAGSLRQAVIDANAAGGTDTITFDPTVFATAKTISLLTALPAITEGVVVPGTGASLLTVRRDPGAGTQFRVFQFAGPVAGVASSISGMTITGGNQLGRGGGVYLSSNDSLTLDGVIVSGNKATIDGGGIAAMTSTALTLLNCTVSGNTAGTEGGGVYHNVGTLIVENSTISGNSASGNGGGVFISSLGNSAISVIRNSTISGNSANSIGGGVIAGSTLARTLTVQNSTIVNNSATTGGGLRGSSGFVQFDISSSIVSDNTATTGPDISASAKVSVTTSLVGKSAGFTLTDLGGNLPFGTNPHLAALANNGGPTLTHAILPGSPLINSGSNPASLTTDQRGAGFNRVNGGGIDIGAFESNLAPTVRKVTVNGGAAQRSRVTSVTVDFDSVVTFSGSAAGAFQIKRQSDNALSLLSAAVSTGATTSVTLTFLAGPAVDFGSLADGRYTLTVDQSKVSANGSQLDGNVDGTGGDNFVLVGTPANGLFRLFGDADGNGQVTSSDFLAFRLAFLSASTAFDYDGNGSVDSGDFLQFRLRFLQSV